jgi:CelD/BcsL family acetyltransferase involved in cellulose biosynthesis
VNLKISGVVAATNEQWQEFWQECPSSTYFHSPEWAGIWQVYSGGRVRPSAKLVSFSDGAQALLPLCFEIKAAGLLSRYVSSTQGTYGGWLTRTPLSLGHALLLVDWLTRQQRRSLVWRLNPYDRLAFQAGLLRNLKCKNDETHALRLQPNADELLKNFKQSYRSQIKKAIASGSFRIEPAVTLQDWQAYFEVYQNSLERWGDAPERGYGWKLFELLFRLRSPNVKLWLARHEGKVVSGDLCVYSPKHVAYWHGATLRDHLRTSVAKLLKYEVIKDACSRGYVWYDFNPSAGLAGVKFFKEGFNPEVLSAPIVYVDSPLKWCVRTCAASIKLQYAQLSLRPLDEVIHPAPASLGAPTPQPMLFAPRAERSAAD